MNKQQRMRELVDTLNESQQDYVPGKSKTSDEDYNRMMLELVGLEFELGVKMTDSPTKADGFIESLEMLSELSNGKGKD